MTRDEEYELVLKLCRNSVTCHTAYNEGYSGGYEGVLFNENVNSYAEGTSEHLCLGMGFAEGASDN
jgi:hypothetical protein